MRTGKEGSEKTFSFKDSLRESTRNRERNQQEHIERGTVSFGTDHSASIRGQGNSKKMQQ